MQYIMCLVGLIIGLFSPAAGVLFLIPAASRVFIEEQVKITTFLGVWAVACGLLYLVHFIDHISALNLVIGTGVNVFFLFFLLKKEQALPHIFLYILILNIVYVVCRQYFFATEMLRQYAQSAEMAMQFVGTRFAEDSEQYQLFAEMMALSQTFFARYNAGVWTATMMLCLTSGYFVMARRREEMLPISFYQTHLYVIYSFVVALTIAVFVPNSVYAINYLIAITPLFLMQGIGIITYKVGKWFTHSPVLVAVAILCLVLNPYIVLFISVLGLLDNWFDFRKMSKTDGDEDIAAT